MNRLCVCQFKLHNNSCKVEIFENKKFHFTRNIKPNTQHIAFDVISNRVLFFDSSQISNNNTVLDVNEILVIVTIKKPYTKFLIYTKRAFTIL